MNKKIISVAVALAVAIAAAAFVFKKQTTLNRDETIPADTAGGPGVPAPGAAAVNGTQAPGAKPAGQGPDANAPAAKAVPFGGGVPDAEKAEAAKIARTPLKPEEKKSLAMLTKAMVKYIQPKYAKPDFMLADLKKAGLQPVVAKDFNEATGKMLVIRTEQTLPGERYFHAQYFEDEEKQQFAQHISFELRPSTDGMEAAIAAARAAIKEISPKNAKLGEPVKVSEDFVKFPLPDNRELWIKRLSAEDLAGDPFNAHDPETDVGSYKIAVEQIPDDHSHEGSHE